MLSGILHLHGHGVGGLEAAAHGSINIPSQYKVMHRDIKLEHFIFSSSDKTQAKRLKGSATMSCLLDARLSSS